MRNFIEKISKNGLKFIKKDISLKEAYNCDESFITANRLGNMSNQKFQQKVYIKNK